MQSLVYYIGLIAVFVFAITGVLAAARRTPNIISLIMLGIITALGGGTIRDIILGTPVFWLTEFIYVWVALAGSIAAFFLFRWFRRSYNLLLYLDALGVAIFAVQAMQKSLDLDSFLGVAIIMGIITGIGGGLIRDILAGRSTLLVSKDLYITPILAGCIVFALLLTVLQETTTSALLAAAFIFVFRAAAIRWDLRMPDWLHVNVEEE